MKTLRLGLGLALLLTGCGPVKRFLGKGDKPVPAATTPQAQPESKNKATKAPRRAGGQPPVAPHYPTVTPVNVLAGKVVSVRAEFRFVVLDFALQALPAVGQRLNLYRQGQKVGEVRVTGPSADTQTVADLVSGEAQMGDEARED